MPPAHRFHAHDFVHFLLHSVTTRMSNSSNNTENAKRPLSPSPPQCCIFPHSACSRILVIRIVHSSKYLKVPRYDLSLEQLLRLFRPLFRFDLNSGISGLTNAPFGFSLDVNLNGVGVAIYGSRVRVQRGVSEASETMGRTDGGRRGVAPVAVVGASLRRAKRGVARF